MPMKWTRKLDGYHNDRPLYDYEARLGSVRFSICKSTEGGFGLSVYDEAAHKYVTPRHGITWLRTLGRCKAEAEKIARSQSDLRKLLEKTDGE